MIVLDVEIFQMQAKKKQECIPVGCVPPTSCPYLPACTAPGGVPARGVYLVPGGCTCPGGVPGPGGCTCLGGIPGLGGVYLPAGVYLPGGHLPRYPPVKRMADRCKNITLPQTSFAGGNKEKKTALRFPSFGGGAIVRLRGDVMIQ